MRAFVVVAVLFLAAVSTAQAETFPVIKNQTVIRVCGECHMAFPPQTLPKAAWRKIIQNLSEHFGEDASIDPSKAAEILDYHTRNASDVSNVRAARKWNAKGLFERITDAPRFRDKHGSCPDDVWKSRKVSSKANCLDCHGTMQKDGSTGFNIGFLPEDQQVKCVGGRIFWFMNKWFNDN